MVLRGGCTWLIALATCCFLSRSDAFAPERRFHQRSVAFRRQKASHHLKASVLPSFVENVNLDEALEQLQSVWRNFQLPQIDLSGLNEQISSIDGAVLEQLKEVSTNLQESLFTAFPFVQPIYKQVTAWVSPLLLGAPPLALIAATVLTYILVNTIATWGDAPTPSRPYPLNKYDPAAAQAYFEKRLPQVFARGIEITVQSLQFGLSLLQDKIEGKIAEREAERGQELAQLLTKLGPSFIKVGQSLSIRTDLLSPAYARGLATLQDQVPPFDTKQAEQILEAEWGRPIDDVVESLPSEPIAAASLGQVYKAKLKKNGQEVAIKVQRPGITEQIALDLYLLRVAAPIVRDLFNLNTDTVGTVDAWGAGFVDELDYIQEADNAVTFMEQVQETPLKDVVLAPSVVDEYTTQSVLVTEWIDGVRLDQSSNEDVTVLCSIAMNTYLTMMLELGTLHCDPHPGNLLRTTDGRLCILDWGMVTRLDRNLQLTLIEHMAHLTSSDYGEVPRDLLLLDFIPQSKSHLIEDSGIVEVLADIYGAWTKGGGAAAINVNEVIGQLQDLQASKGRLFQIPPYFAYIAKSFSVLEGIGLSNDAKYSIINECLPYVSQRLLTDKDKMGPALSSFIFGPDKNDDSRFVDYKRVEQLLTGFGNYSTSASGALLSKENASKTEIIEDAVDQLLDLVITEEASPLQEILVDQIAKIVMSGSRSIWSNVLERSGKLPSGRTVLGTLVDPLGIWRTSPLVRLSRQDEEQFETTQRLFNLVRNQIRETDNSVFDLSKLSREEALEVSTVLGRKLWERRMALFQTSNRFARKLLVLTVARLEKGERAELPPSQQAQIEAAKDLDRSLSSAATSPRLAEARRILADVHTEAAEVEEAVPESMPVKTTI